MKSTTIQVLPATAIHANGWRDLWDMYCAGAVASDVSDTTWRRILDTASPIGSVVAMLDDQVVGLATYVEHECTWETKSVCYIEDMIVGKLHRGPRLNVGHAMGVHLIGRLRSGEWSRLHCVTHADNILAQKLYAQYAEGEPYVRYVMKGNKL